MRKKDKKKAALETPDNKFGGLNVNQHLDTCGNKTRGLKISQQEKGKSKMGRIIVNLQEKGNPVDNNTN